MRHLLPVIECKGVGPSTAQALRRLEITTIAGLLYHLPRGYLDRRKISRIKSISGVGPAVIQGGIEKVGSRRISRRLHITRCTVSDSSGSMKALWFNQPYLARTLEAQALKDAEAIFSGVVSDRRGLQMENPDVEIISDGENDPLHTLGLIPLYPLTRGLGHRKMRRIIRAALDAFLKDIPENLPQRVIKAEGLKSRREALGSIHFPVDETESVDARNRIAFEEFLALQLKIQGSNTGASRFGTAHDSKPSLTKAFEKMLPFMLSGAQTGAIERISRLMESPEQMNVLLQGDVGSGKTVVAVHAMLKSVENGRQAILMAPTEVLAEQHFTGLFEGVATRLKKEGIGVALLTGSSAPAGRDRALELLSSGRPSLVFGTHALIQQKIRIPNAGLIVIDEQHRFGVNQRAALKEKGMNADLLIMTATPIPRTLALALYGDFETVLIDRLPEGRHPVKTARFGEKDRERLYGLIEGRMEEGRQVFVVCPEIESSDAGAGGSLSAAVGARREYGRRFSNFTTGLLHGRMSPQDRAAALDGFRGGEIKLLVATTIIEVGVDVPNAAVIVIEGADRFGLAQLHQLRGRVGRSGHESSCFLVADPATEEAGRRLDIMGGTSDGFEISEQDLLLRGPGEFLGAAQSGLPPLRAGHLLRDCALLERTRDVAAKILRDDPALSSSDNAPLRVLLNASGDEACSPDTVHY